MSRRLNRSGERVGAEIGGSNGTPAPHRVAEFDRAVQMLTHFVLTLSGPDRIGIVQKVTGLLFERGGNVETSRMARLGGEFAILMFVSIAEAQFDDLELGLSSLTDDGYKITIRRAQQTYAAAFPGWQPFRIEVQGADHEGIIHQVAHYLARLGINIEWVESGTTPAPITGIPLFTMSAQVVAPPGLSRESWHDGLNEIGGRLNLEVRVTPLQGA